MKKKMLAFLMAVLIVVGIFPVTAMAKSKDTTPTDLSILENWNADRTEPNNFAINDGKITFSVKENPQAEEWYAWQGRIAYTNIPLSQAWAVEYKLNVTEEMLNTDKVNASVWIQVDKAGTGTVQNQQNCVDWCIVKYSKETSTPAWQTWNSTNGQWTNAEVVPTAGEHTVKTTFRNGTITQYIDGTQINTYTLENIETSPVALIAQARSYGASFNVSIGVPTVDYGVAKIGDTKYATLAAAIEAVPADTETTITMIDDEVLSAGVTVPATKKSSST